MIKGIFGLIIIVFIFWGVGGMHSGEKTVAEVGSHKVTMMEYQEAYTGSLTCTGIYSRTSSTRTC